MMPRWTRGADCKGAIGCGAFTSLELASSAANACPIDLFVPGLAPVDAKVVKSSSLLGICGQKRHSRVPQRAAARCECDDGSAASGASAKASTYPLSHRRWITSYHLFT